VSDEQRLQQLEQLEFAYSGLSEWAQNRQDGTLTLGLSSADVRREMQKPRTHAGVQVALETTDQMRERIQKAEADNGFGTGALLAAMREAHGLDIDDVQKSLKISKEFVVAFEQEDFSRFPAPIYAKGFLKNLLRHLSYDRSEDFANHYLEMYKEWRTNQKSQRTSKSLSSKIAV
jgi:hypothetical protein